MVLFEVVEVYALSCSNAAAVVTGNTIGESDLETLRRNTRNLQLMFLINGILASVLMSLTGDVFLRFYSLTPQAHGLARRFIRVLSLTMIGTSYEYPVEIGIIQSGGYFRYALVIDSLFPVLCGYTAGMLGYVCLAPLSGGDFFLCEDRSSPKVFTQFYSSEPLQLGAQNDKRRRKNSLIKY